MTKNKNSFCTNCGKELTEDSKFCQFCGEKVEQIEEKESKKIQEHTEETSIEVEKIEKPKRARRKSKDDLDDNISKTIVDEDKIETEVNESIKKEPLNIIIDEDMTIPEENKPVEVIINEEPKENSIKDSDEVNQLRKEKFEKSKKYIYPVIAVVVTFVICLIAFACFYQYYLKNLVIETTKREVTVTDTGISEAVEKVYDSVVVVESYSKNRLYATGTGFVYKTDDKVGYILTNNHVIEGADEVKVVFTNNKRVSVDVVGSDSYSDVALLGVDKDKVISVAEIGSSEDLKLGDTTFAVGSPLDSSTYAWTVTRGVISGKNRTVAVSSSNSNVATQVMQVLQTDTAINSGNSGGPLCNSNGQVIGITNMKLASSQVEGMGFAIPIETATKYAEKFIKGEEITYPYVGVTVADAQPTYRNPDASGVSVQAVENGSPAARGGLQKGDKILKINDVEVENSSFFKFELYKYDIGDKIEITVERDGKEKVLTITLGSKGMNA